MKIIYFIQMADRVIENRHQYTAILTGGMEVHQHVTRDDHTRVKDKISIHTETFVRKIL